MPDSATTSAPLSTPALPPDPDAPARAPEVALHLVAALLIGSAAPFLVLWTSPAYAFGVAPLGFELVDVMPQLVALLALGIALLARLRGLAWLRGAGWLVAAVGLLGLAGLFAQGNRLDGQSLTVALIVVIALQAAGLLLALAAARGASRWAVALGVAAGVAGGREVVALLVGVVREGPLAGSLHGDDVVFAGLGLLVAVAGVALLVLGRAAEGDDAAAGSPSAWWAIARWPVLAVVVASVLAVGLTRVWNAQLEEIAQSYIGGISEQDALAVQTQDQLVRVGIALLVVALLVAAAQRGGCAGAARWVLVAFGAALLLAGLEGFGVYEPSWGTALLALAGAAAGAVLVHRAARAVPWEAVGLVLAAALLLPDAPAVLHYVAAVGFGIAVAAGLLRLAPLPAASDRAVRVDHAGVATAVALGLAAWALCHQAVFPAAAVHRTDLGGIPILPLAMVLAALAAVAFFLIDRRRVTPARRQGSTAARDERGADRAEPQ